MRRFTDLLKRFRRDESGAFMVLFAVIAIVLIATSGAVVDFTYMQTARSRAQTALDAAALALQSRINDSNAQATIKADAQSILRERLADSAITATVNNVVLDTENAQVTLQASITVPTAFVQLVGIRSITANLTSQVTQSTQNLELSLALDTTGSMGQTISGSSETKIAALQDATKWMIENLIKDTQPTAGNQTIAYTRMAITPWSAAVRPPSGTSVTSLRGTPIGSSSITGIAWKKTTTVNISSITKANPAVITTSSPHGLSTGDYVYISGVNGMTQLSSGIYTVSKVSPTQVKLLKTNGTNVNSSSYSTYSTSPSSGKITGCLNSGCNLEVTSNSKGLAQGDYVYLSGINGMTSLNDSKSTNSATAHLVGTVTSTKFVLATEGATTVGNTAYTSGGTAQCVKYGCAYMYFPSYTRSGFGGYTYISASGHSIYYPSNCVTERPASTGHQTDDYTPAAGSPNTYPGSYLGIHYNSGSNGVGSDCPSDAAQPLTDDKDVLETLAKNLSAGGSTAGHIGLAWGWYMLAPNFHSFWPTAYTPAAYSSTNVIKAIVLMTDGIFNLQYCDGVQTDENPDDGVSNTGTFSSCDPETDPDGNGWSKTQASALCDAIKTPSNNTILYTVGFDMKNDITSQNFLKDCATSDSDFIEADTTDGLQAAFQKIARDLNKLRLSK